MEITQLFLESMGLQKCVLKQYDLKTNIYISCDIFFYHNALHMSEMIFNTSTKLQYKRNKLIEFHLSSPLLVNENL